MGVAALAAAGVDGMVAHAGKASRRALANANGRQFLTIMMVLFLAARRG